MHLVVASLQTQLRRMAGVAATCMRSTIGSGCLGAASPVRVVSCGLSVAETAVRKSARHVEQVKSAVATRRRRKEAKASSK